MDVSLSVARKKSFLSLGLCLAVLALSPLGGCMDAKAVFNQIKKDEGSADRALRQLEPSKVAHKALMVDSQPWYGATAIPIQNGQPLPPLLQTEDGIVLTFEKPMQFREVARMIQAATGIRVTVQEAAPMAGNARFGDDAGNAFIPADGVEVSGGRIVWQGSLPNILDQISDAFDAEWDYDGATLSLREEVTRTFMLHALADQIDFESEIENATNDDSGILPEVSIDSTAEISIWEEIQGTVDSILNARGRATYSPSTGTITVNGPPSLVGRVEDYLREQNKLRLRRVAVAVKVLAVSMTDINDVSFNLSGLFEELVNKRAFRFTAVGDGLTAGVLRTLPTIDPVTGFPSTEADSVDADTNEVSSILEATEQVEKVSLVNSGAIITLSDIPAPLQIGRTIAYLERVSAAGGNAGGTSLEPGEVNLGLTMNVLPRVIQKDRVLLRLAIGITDAETPFATFEVGDLSIQLPEVETTGFLQNAVLSAGETLVLAGFEKNQSSLNDDGVPGGLWTGGDRSIDQRREVTVLLISSEVLPEEPLTVIRG